LIDTNWNDQFFAYSRVRTDANSLSNTTTFKVVKVMHSGYSSKASSSNGVYNFDFFWKSNQPVKVTLFIFFLQQTEHAIWFLRRKFVSLWQCSEFKNGKFRWDLSSRNYLL